MAKNFVARTIDTLGKNLKPVSRAPFEFPPPSFEQGDPRPHSKVGGKHPPVPTTTTETKPKKKKKAKVEEYLSASSDNEKNLSFVDEAVDEEENPFVNAIVKGARHYSSSRQRKRHVMSSSESDDDDGEEEDDESSADSDRDGEDHVFTRRDGSDLRYGRDEFVQQEDSSEERLEKRNARRLARGESLIHLEPEESESAYEAGSILMAMSSSSSSAAASRVEEKSREDSSESELINLDMDETKEVLADARHILKVHKHRVRPVERETQRAAEVRKIEKALFDEVDSEADTVDGKAPEESSDEEDGEEEGEEEEEGNNQVNSLSATQACVDKLYKELNVVLVDGTELTNPLKGFEMAGLFEAFKTLSATNLNAAVEQQTSKNIQAQINQGHSNIPGQSASRKQSEIVQESLHFLDGFMKKDAILEILQRAVEEV